MREIINETLTYEQLKDIIRFMFPHKLVKDLTIQDCIITECPDVENWFYKHWTEYKRKFSFNIFGIKISIEWKKIYKNIFLEEFIEVEGLFINRNIFKARCK